MIKSKSDILGLPMLAKHVMISVNVVSLHCVKLKLKLKDWREFF